MKTPRLLGVLLCYNDADILGDTLEHLLETGHDVVAWNHGSTDDTPGILKRYANHLREMTDVSRSVDFYDLYPLMSKHLLKNYVSQYDWISWPDEDELLEGPNRSKSYREYLAEAVESPYNWIRFRDCEFCCTEKDDLSLKSPVRRIRHYALRTDGPPKIRSWRASATNVRYFNHNPPIGEPHPELFNLRHYAVRSAEQIKKRLSERVSIRRGPINYHYGNIRQNLPRLELTADQFHFDDGRSDLDLSPAFDWKALYGDSPTIPAVVTESSRLFTFKWDVAGVLTKALARWQQMCHSAALAQRVGRWLLTLEARPDTPVLAIVDGQESVMVTGELVKQWEADPGGPETDLQPKSATLPRLSMVMGSPDPEGRVMLDVRLNRPLEPAPLIAILPVTEQSVNRFTVFSLQGGRGATTLSPGRYILAIEPASEVLECAP